MATPSKFVLVTGCDTGFGRLAVDLFDKENVGVFASVFVESNVQKIKSECPSGRVVPVHLDVTSEASVQNCADFIQEYITKNNAHLIAVVNNSGILVQPCPTEWQSVKDFRDMFEVNVIGTASITKAVLPMIRACKGRVVCTASIAGRTGLPANSAYCTSKFAVEGYAESLRRDMLPFGVTVHIIEPGVFPNTNLYERFEKGLDAVWARLDPKIQEDYGNDHYQYVRKSLGLVKNTVGTTDSSLVPKAYVHAVLDEKPMYRYRVGWDSKYLVTALNQCHESTADLALTNPDPRLPYVKPAMAPADGKELAMGRMDKGWKRFLTILLIVAIVLYKVRQSGRA